MIENPNVDLVMVGGASGVGKSTYLNEVANRSGALLISFSGEIYRVVNEMSGKSYPNLPTSWKIAAKEIAGARVLARVSQMEGTVILDAHYIDKSIDLRMPAMPDFFWRSIDRFVLLDAEPNEIRRRRLKDIQRRRSPSLAEIYTEVESEARVIRQLALQFAKPFEIIDLNKTDSELKYDLYIDRGTTYPLVRKSKE